MVDYHHLTSKDEAIIFTDFRKAFDSLEWIYIDKCLQLYGLIPLHIHGFSYESLRIAQIHGSFTDPHDLATFTTDLRVVTSYYELFTVCYGLLRVITIYLRQNSTICYELSRITTSNLRVTNDLLTCCYE